MPFSSFNQFFHHIHHIRFGWNIMKVSVKQMHVLCPCKKDNTERLRKQKKGLTDLTPCEQQHFGNWSKKYFGTVHNFDFEVIWYDRKLQRIFTVNSNVMACHEDKWGLAPFVPVLSTHRGQCGHSMDCWICAPTCETVSVKFITKVGCVCLPPGLEKVKEKKNLLA